MPVNTPTCCRFILLSSKNELSQTEVHHAKSAHNTNAGRNIQPKCLWEGEEKGGAVGVPELSACFSVVCKMQVRSAQWNWSSLSDWIRNVSKVPAGEDIYAVSNRQAVNCW